MQKRLADCQRVIGYCFADEALLEVALTHSSVRSAERECNERQEFLGDSVLGLAMTEELYKRLPDQQEGELTRIKSAVVSRGALYRVSMRLGLPRFVEVAKGVGRREEIPVSVTANLVEAIIGAIYLDAGFFPAREFILRHLGPELEDVFNDRVPKNYKSLVQHEAQQLFGTTPIYRTIEEEGPDHRKSFTVACIVRGTEYGRANGINKKEAEQEAARHALDALTRRGRGGRRRRDARDTRGGREGDREPVRSGGRPASEEDAWREWAEAHAGSPASGGTGGAEGASPVVRPEADDAWHDGTQHAGAEGHDASPAGESHAVPAEADASAPAETPGGSGASPEAADAPTAAPAAEGAEAGGEDPGPRRRRRGGRGRGGRGRGGRGRGAGDDASPAPDAAPEGVGAEADASHAPPAEPELAPAPEAPPPAREEGGRRRGGARSRLDRYRDDAEAPAAPVTPSAPAAPSAGSSRPSKPAFGLGVEAEPARPPASPEKAVTQLGGVPSVKKAPKADAPRGGGGFGAGL